MKIMVLAAVLVLPLSMAAVTAGPSSMPSGDGPAPMVPAMGVLRVPEGLEPRISFWVDIYTLYSTRQAVIHDENYPQVIYGVIDLGASPEGGPGFPDGDQEVMEEARQRVAEIIRRLDVQGGEPGALSEEEQLVRDALALLPATERGRRAAGRVRSQRGLQDRFRQGLIRAGRYLERFRAIARQEGVPEDLSYLPHVESSFQSDARSHAGATGLWQFMRSTGRRYLNIDEVLDERLDPFLSARAAFQVLRENYVALGSWPLALTAYNHGLAGMRRAQKRFGNDLPAIIQGYKARTFGFASKSFYAEFLAARRIAARPAEWFGELAPDPPLRFRPVLLPDFALAGKFCHHFALDLDQLRQLNPALSRSVWEGKRLMPRGYPLRLPLAAAGRVARDWSSLPRTARFDRQVRTTWHRVKRGENLWVIARRYHTSVRQLLAMNHLDRRSLIHPGQKLRVRQEEHWVGLKRQAEPPAMTISTAVAQFLRHVVRRGETLSSIGLRYGIRVSRLVQTNDLKDASRIQAGQILLIPHAH